MTFQEARKIIESIEFLDSMNIPFDLEEKSNVTANFPFFKDPRWYESTWFGNYYDSTKGWLFHEYLGWIYTEGAVEGGVVWHDNIGWFWTKDGTYPYLYSQYSSRLAFP